MESETAGARGGTWQEGDDGRVGVGTLVEVGGHLRRALAAVAADGGPVPDVAVAVDRHRDLTVALLSGVDRLAELHLGHCGFKGITLSKHSQKGVMIRGIIALDAGLSRICLLIFDK